MSVCNGAFWLANAGLLDGQRATTTANHNLELMAEQFPRIHVVDDQRYVDNGRIITTAGLSSGIDGALHVIERLDGRGAARAVALPVEPATERFLVLTVHRRENFGAPLARICQALVEAFMADPEWNAARADSEKAGPINANVTSSFLTPTAFSSVK